MVTLPADRTILATAILLAALLLFSAFTTSNTRQPAGSAIAEIASPAPLR